MQAMATEAERNHDEAATEHWRASIADALPCDPPQSKARNGSDGSLWDLLWLGIDVGT
jgi:hypothetical protein